MVRNADKLAQAGIKLLAIDFDLTLVSTHTGGVWSKGAEHLAQHVRPSMKQLILTAMMDGIHVAIVTFSPQVKLICEVLALAFPKQCQQIVVRGLDKSWPYYADGTRDGKQPHMASVAEELACRRATLVSRKATLLIDDDFKNVELALRNGVNAVLCSPRDPASVDRVFLRQSDSCPNLYRYYVRSIRETTNASIHIAQLPAYSTHAPPRAV